MEILTSDIIFIVISTFAAPDCGQHQWTIILLKLFNWIKILIALIYKNMFSQLLFKHWLYLTSRVKVNELFGILTKSYVTYIN